MPSENAKAVAKDVLEAVRKGAKVNKGEIIRKHGYAKSVSLHPDKVTETKTFKEEILPVVEQMEKERLRLLDAISKKNLDKVHYKDAVDAADKLTKNIQLLNGGRTSNAKVSFGWDE